MPSTSSTEPAAPLRVRRPLLLLAVAAGLCWACAIALLLSADLAAARAPLAPLRVIFYLLVLSAALLTFVPARRILQVRGLATEGVAGAALLLYALAFVPPPTAWLLALPDLPVYLIFIAGLFWCSSALALPPIYALGTWMFHQRARRYDTRRARRQAHEFGALLALCAALAGLRVLTPLGVVLLIFILIVAELLFLSFIEPGP